MREENVFGKKVNVGSADEIIEQFTGPDLKLYLCRRVADAPITMYPLVMREVMGMIACTTCNELVYYDTRNEQMMSNFVVICNHCEPRKYEAYTTQASIDLIKKALRSSK